MNPTDEIIAQRRKGAEDGERGEFSVDRSQALEKMRRFSLGDPRYFLLELVQAAVANEATQVNVDLYGYGGQRGDMRMQWNGHGFSELELMRLFDFLFIADDDPGCADTILLARSLNSMLHFNPDLVSVTSGDGTLQGTRRILLRDAQPLPIEWIVREPIDGVRIEADGLEDWLLPRDNDEPLREIGLLAEKCISPSLAVVVNRHIVSDWSSSFGSAPQGDGEFIDIDEGDLYGRLWRPARSELGCYDLMT